MNRDNSQAAKIQTVIQPSKGWAMVDLKELILYRELIRLFDLLRRARSCSLRRDPVSAVFHRWPASVAVI